VAIRSTVFDVGETLIDETRIFQRWADRMGIPRLAFLGTLGAVLNSGGEVSDAFRLMRPGLDVGAEIAAWREEDPHGLREGFDGEDLYPDVRATLAALRGRGLRVLLAGNQPAQARPALEAMGLAVDGVVVSEEWGVAKPDPEFFRRVAEVAGHDPADIVYVGDRVDNDVLPAKAAGMHAVLLRRGPHGYVHSQRPEARKADAVLDDLTGLLAWLDQRASAR
jgi:HAD superfamily hydrolase (TIGR01509 family)